MRRTQPITKKAKISSTTHVHCYNGYMVNNNTDLVAVHVESGEPDGEGRLPVLAVLALPLLHLVRLQVKGC